MGFNPDDQSTSDFSIMMSGCANSRVFYGLEIHASVTTFLSLPPVGLDGFTFDRVRCSGRRSMDTHIRLEGL